TIDLGGYNQAIASLAGSGSVTNVTNAGLGAPAVLTISGGVSSQFDGTITDGAGQIGLTLTSNPVTGFGSTLTLTNSNGNTYSGATQIDLGSTLSAGNTNVFSANSAFTANGTIDLGGYNQAI